MYCVDAGILGLAEETFEPGSAWFLEYHQATEAESNGLTYNPAGHSPGNLGNPSLFSSMF